LIAGVAHDFSYVSTTGGAFLEWMEGKALCRASKRCGARGTERAPGAIAPIPAAPWRRDRHCSFTAAR
jgi:hypothetical protein